MLASALQPGSTAAARARPQPAPRAAAGSARLQPRRAAVRLQPRRRGTVAVRAEGAASLHFLTSFVCFYTAWTWMGLRRARIQAEKIDQLNREREAERQERLRRLQPATVPAEAAEQARVLLPTRPAALRSSESQIGSRRGGASMRKQYDPAKLNQASSPPPPPPRRQQAASNPAGPSQGPLRPALSLTLLCPVFCKTGSCAKGELCMMAHGMAEAEALQQQRSGEVPTPPQQSPAAPASLGAATRSSHVLVVPRPPPPPGPQQQRPAAAGHEQKPDLYRTKLCWAFARSGHCMQGDRCNYAHGHGQLRLMPDRLRQQNGQCPYWRAGHCKKDNCQYWHGDMPSSSGGGSGSCCAPPPLLLPQASGSQVASAQYASQQEELTALLQGTFLQKQQQHLLCPITLEPFEDPVVAADGRIYERSAIEDWLYREGNNTSPLTNQPLAHKMLMPCDAMRQCVAEVVEFVESVRRQFL
ncbi:vacuolar sorting 23A [Chlorella sorokiniana]|uniref:Vacuolar sorting 23A n=1 Tax=Chlorella sorokiniana TaxID=3076 RepID=A0A2P6TP93_CHLSO|nr:vacuolar sorting 23A [Chlorella sorokiniana]|eukprot:PRW51129.1 vacuolar sorting 23A [Chlorella sorokiniana]